MSYEEKQGVLLGKETKKKLMSGDQLRVRITAVSLGRAGSSGKIGVTARQPFLGKLEWLKLDSSKTKEAAEKTAESKKEESSAEKEWQEWTRKHAQTAIL